MDNNSCNSSYSVSQEWLEAFNKLNAMGKPKVINKARLLDIYYNTITLFENYINVFKSII